MNRNHKFACPHCEKSFVSKTKLTAHAQIHSDNTANGACDMNDSQIINCDKNDLDRASEKEGQELGDNHLCSPEPEDMEDGGKTLDEISEELPLPRQQEREVGTICFKCRTEFRTETENRSHIALPHPFDCNHCELHFRSEPRLRYHSVICHDTEDQIQADCTVCNSRFPEIPDFLNHIETEHKHGCDECSSRFVDLISLERHGELSHPVDLSCKLCRMDFKSNQSGYRDHQRTSHKFECHICDKKYIKVNHLLKHLELDHDSADLTCTLCRAVFGDFGPELESHLKVKILFLLLVFYWFF